MTAGQFDLRELSRTFTARVGFSVKRHDYTSNGMRSHALAVLVRRLPEAAEWSDDRISESVRRLAYIDDAVVTLRRHLRMLNGGSRSDKQRLRRLYRLRLQTPEGDPL